MNSLPLKVFVFLLFFVNALIGKPNKDEYLVTSIENKHLRNQLDSANIYVRSDLKKSLFFAKHSETLSSQVNNPKGLIEAKIIQFICNVHLGNASEISRLQREINLLLNQHNNPYFEAEMHHAHGTYFLIAGKQNLAINEFYEAIEINRNHGFLENELKQLNNIGIILIEQKYFEKALDYFTDLYDKATELNHEKYTKFSKGNIGYCYLKIGQFEKALSFIEPTIAFGKSNIDNIGMCMGYAVLAEAYNGLGRKNDALEAINEAIDLSISQEFNMGIIDGYRLKSEILLSLQELDSAYYYVNIAFSKAQETGSFRNYERLLLTKYTCEKNLGYLEHSLETHERLFQFNDSINGVTAKNQIEQAELHNKIQVNARENELLKLQQSQNELQIKNTRFYNGLLVLSIICFALFTTILFILNKQKQRYNKKLEKDILLRTYELEKSNKELERFSFIASHDLKEPVRTIASFSKLLEETIETNSTLKSKEYLTFISSNSNRMQYLIDDILEFSQINSGNNKSNETIDLNSLMREVMSLNKDQISQKNVSFNIDQLPIIKGKKNLLLIAFKNIIENGIKYNESSQIVIKIASKIEEDCFVISIKDNGIGIDDIYFTEIFEMFKRLHDKRKYQGSGMGLAMCKKIIEIHSGSISVESKQGIGTTFYFSLPKDILVSSPKTLKSQHLELA